MSVLKQYRHAVQNVEGGGAATLRVLGVESSYATCNEQSDSGLSPVCMGLLLNELHPAPFPRTGFDGHYGDVSIIPLPGIVICSVPGMLTYRRKILAHAHARAAGLSRLLRHMRSFMSSYLFATLSVTLWVRHYHLMTWHEYALSYSALPIV